MSNKISYFLRVIFDIELDAIFTASTGIVLTKIDFKLVELSLLGKDVEEVVELDPLGVKAVEVEQVCTLGVKRLEVALEPIGEGELVLFERAPCCSRDAA